MVAARGRSAPTGRRGFPTEISRQDECSLLTAAVLVIALTVNIGVGIGVCDCVIVVVPALWGFKLFCVESGL